MWRPRLRMKTAPMTVVPFSRRKAAEPVDERPKNAYLDVPSNVVEHVLPV